MATVQLLGVSSNPGQFTGGQDWITARLRFNGRITDILKTHRFSSAEDLEQTLLRYVALYNYQLPQSALKSKTPMQAMKEWYKEHPQRPYDRPG